MKIQNPNPTITTDRSASAAPTDRSSAQGTGEVRSRQVGLDKVSVSHFAETASRVVESSLRNRQERVSALASQFQSGNYSVNTAELSSAILDHDLESDPAYAI